MEALQAAPAGSEDPQVVAIPNSLEFGPETQRLLTLTGMLAGFETAMVCDADVEPTEEVKARLTGASEIEPASPVPMRAIVCGPPATESLMETAALRVPEEVGAKATAIEQEAEAAREEPQVVVSWKSEACAPDSQMLEIVKADPPVLERVTVCAALDVPLY